MQNFSENHRQKNQPTDAIDNQRDLPPAVVPDGLVDQPLHAARPAWMPVEDWDRICLQLEEKLDELVEHREAEQLMQRDGCQERSWCIVRNTWEHADYHCGDVVAMAGMTDTHDARDPGWMAYLTQDIGQRAQVVIQGEREKFEATIPAAHIAVVLAATATSESREAMWNLITSDGVDG